MYPVFVNEGLLFGFGVGNVNDCDEACGNSSLLMKITIIVTKMNVIDNERNNNETDY